ncbi:hypothetical protein [Sandaracinus amylolyticus]|nr:hypothetical protein [Sandaracinus amylolyticus]
MIDIERRGLPPDIVGNPERSFARADVYAAYHQYALAAARSPDVDRRAFCQSLGSTITGGMGLAEAGARSVLAQSAGRAVHPSSIGETDHASGSARFTRDEIVIGPQFVDMFVHYFDFYRLAIRERAAGMTDISQRVIGDQERELDRLRAWCASLLETHVAEAPLWIRLWEHTRAADDAFEMWNRCSAVRLELGHHFYRRVASEIGEDGLFRRAMSAIASAADNGAQLFSASCEQFCRNIETIRDIRAADVGDFVRTFYGYHGAMTGQRLELPGLEQSRLIVDLAEGRVHIDSGTSRSLAFEFLTTGGDESWPRATSSAAPAEPTWHRYTGDERVRIVEHERYSLEHVPAALHGVVATAQIISTALAFQQVTTELSAQNVRTCVDLGQGVLGTMESAASFLAVIATRHHDYYEPVSRLLRMPGAHPSAALARAASGLGRVATVLGIGAMAYDGAMIFFSRSGDLQHALDRGDDVAALAARTRGGIYVVAAIVETGGLVAALAGASGPWLVIASAVLGLTVVAVDVVALLANGGADHLEELQSAYYDAKRAELFGGERETSLRNLQPRTLDRLRRLSTALRALGS